MSTAHSNFSGLYTIVEFSGLRNCLPGFWTLVVYKRKDGAHFCSFYTWNSVGYCLFALDRPFCRVSVLGVHSPLCCFGVDCCRRERATVLEIDVVRKSEVCRNACSFDCYFWFPEIVYCVLVWTMDLTILGRKVQNQRAAHRWACSKCVQI